MDRELAQTSQFCQVFGGSVGNFDYGGFASEDCHPFAIVDGKIVNWCCMCGRAFVSRDGESVSVQPNATAWLEITHPTTGHGFSIDVLVGGSYQNSATKTYLRLYEFDGDGLVRRDYRGMPTLPFYN